jgi:hypothetical protein
LTATYAEAKVSPLQRKLSSTIRSDATTDSSSVSGHVAGVRLSVQHRIFASSTKAWEALCAEASAFASEIGREKLINISVAASGGTEWFGRGGSGVIVV